MRTVSRTAPWCLALSLGAGIAPASAEISATVGADVLYDSNIFRISRDLADTTGEKRDDTVTSVNGRVVATTNPGLTRLTLDASAGHDWYRRNDSLDNFHYRVDLGATKTEGGVLGFDLHALAERRLTSFSDLGVPVRNRQNLQRLYGQVTLAITPELRVVAVPELVRNTNGNAAFRANDFRQYGAGLGIGYFSPLGNSVSATVSRAYGKGLRDRIVLVDGTPVNSPIDYVDTSGDLWLTYSPGAFTTVAARLSYVERKNRSVTGGSYSGPAGNLTITYRPRETFELKILAERRLESQSYVYVETIRNDRAAVRTRFDFTGGRRLEAGAEVARRRFTTGSPLIAGERSLRDWTYRVDAALEQRLAERFRLRLAGQHERRTADNRLFSYKSTSVMLGVAFTFGGTAK